MSAVIEACGPATFTTDLAASLGCTGVCSDTLKTNFRLLDGLTALGQLMDLPAAMSALPPKADACSANRHVCFGPKADIATYSITSSARLSSDSGTARPSILAVLRLITNSNFVVWEDIDFDANVIHIQRMQERDGSITGLTKTAAGTRDVPMCGLLRSMLLKWRLVCPRYDGSLHRVFPGLGRPQPWPLMRQGGGGPLLYGNFRNRFWAPTLYRLGLPAVTPHSARHSFVSTLQAQGIEIGLVAKIAGHSNANVTLGHYTQAVRGGQDAIAALERAYTARCANR